MGPKEVPEESVPERDRRGVTSRNVALVAVMCAVHSGDANTGARGNGSRRHYRG